MYEELVKMLRKHYDEHCPLDGASGICGGVLANEAADAIETLIEVIQNHDFLKSLIKPRWIPVTENPPKAYEEVLLLFPHNQAVGFCDRDGCWGVYSGDGFYTEVADNEPKPTHWARKLPEPSKEEA